MNSRGVIMPTPPNSSKTSRHTKMPQLLRVPAQQLGHELGHKGMQDEELVNLALGSLNAKADSGPAPPIPQASYIRRPGATRE